MAVLYEAGEFVTPQLLSCKENELGLRQWLEDKVLIWQATCEVDSLCCCCCCCCSDTELESVLSLLCYLQGHEYVVVADKDGPDSQFEKEIEDAEIMISTPFHPGYLTKYGHLT